MADYHRLNSSWRQKKLPTRLASRQDVYQDGWKKPSGILLKVPCLGPKKHGQTRTV